MIESLVIKTPHGTWLKSMRGTAAMRLSPEKKSKDGADDWHLETRMDRDVKSYLVEYCKERKGNNPKCLGKLPSSKCVV